MSVDGIDGDQSFFVVGVVGETTPWPIPRMLHESPFDRIGVHVMEFFFLFRRTPHIEIEETALPETRVCAEGIAEVQGELVCRSTALLAAHSSRDRCFKTCNTRDTLAFFGSLMSKWT